MRQKMMWLLCVVFFFVSCAAAFAAEGDVPVAVHYEKAGKTKQIGAGFMRGADVWIPEESAKLAGIPLLPGPNGKGFLLQIQDPAKIFEIKEMERLAGKTLTLYFPSAVEDEVSYFNVAGMERVTRLAVQNKNGVTLRAMTPNEPLPQKLAKPNAKIQGKLKLVWDHVVRDNKDLSKEPEIKGLHAISPTWFNMTGADGGMANRASAAYVEEAHKRGYRVWALVSNGFSRSMTTQFLRNPRGVNLFIARLLAYAKLYNLDGFNVDFEGLDANDSELFVRFMSILSDQLKVQGLSCSVDVHIPGTSNASRSHDRGELAKYADYVMLMAYDQHWRTSPKSGSVASMPWVERAVQGSLAEGVPKNKLVLGVPFYMRRWEETPADGGKVKVKSFTLTMEEAESVAQRTGAAMHWLEDMGQHYFSYIENNKTYKVWVENAQSIERKLGLVKKYDLAGMAAWRRGHEKFEVWETINKLLP